MLEALIAILIVALGILGTVGLYARSVQHVDDAKFRGEAALLASSLIGQMWLTDSPPGPLAVNSIAPTVTITPGPTAASSNVAILIQWFHPGDELDPTQPTYREFSANATIGSNTVP